MFNRRLKIVLLLSFLFVGCQSSELIKPGIQPGFEAVNPAAIIAVPIFIIPDPSSEAATLDPSLILTEKLIPLLENKIINSFNNQPNINGYPFAMVKKAIGYTPPQEETKSRKKSEKNSNLKIQKSSSSSQILNERELANGIIWNRMNQTMKDVANRFSSREIATRLLITPNCLARRNFVEFYSFCLASETPWLENLNLLSARVLNADSALFTVITELKDQKTDDNKYSIVGGLAVFLVDTNNGKLIWGNYGKETLTNGEDKKYFPSWNTLFDNILATDFWNGFPGRIGKNQLTDPTEKVKE